jgi:putative endonuclease
VFTEQYPTARQAIAREKQLKGWSRAKKLRLIREGNPEWKNFSLDATQRKDSESVGS